MTIRCNYFGPFESVPGNKHEHSNGFITFNETPRVMSTLEIEGSDGKKIKIKGKSIAEQEKEKKMSQNGGGMNYAYINKSSNCRNIHPEYPHHRYTNAQSVCPLTHHNHHLTRYTLANIDNSPMFHSLSYDHRTFATGTHNLTPAASHMSYF